MAVLAKLPRPGRRLALKQGRRRLLTMPFTPPQSHWRGTDPGELETVPAADAAAGAAATDRYRRITRSEQIAIVAVAIAMLLAAWWLH